MNRIVLFLMIAIVSVNNLMAQEMFTHLYGGESFDRGQAIVQASDNGYYFAANTGSFFLDNSQIMLTRLSEQGSQLWSRVYGGEFADVVSDMAILVNDGLILVGYTETLDNAYQVAILRLDASGDTIWTRNYGGSNWDVAYSVVALADGGFAVAGQTYSYGLGNSDVYLLRLDANGDTLWTRTYGGSGADGGKSVAVTNDNGFIVGGFVEDAYGFQDVYLLRLNDQGDVIWSKTYGGAFNDIANAVVSFSNGDFAFAGGKGGGGETNFNLWQMRIDAQGDSIKDQLISGPLNDIWHSLVVNQWEEMVAVGYSQTTTIGGGGDDMYFSRLGWDEGISDFIFRTSTTYGAGGNEQANDVIFTSDQGYAVIGWTNGFVDGVENVMLVKTDPFGAYVNYSVGIDTPITSEVKGVIVYPNPASNIVNFAIGAFQQWAGASQKTVTIDILDYTGRAVLQQNAQSEQTTIDLTGFADGMYLYRISAENQPIANGRLVIARQ